MPYKDKDRKREYQRKWIAERRAQYLAEHGPCIVCGCANGLQIDHIDPTKKVDHKIFSWSAIRREAELAKCQILCIECHKKKTSKDDIKAMKETVDAIRALYATGNFTQTEIGNLFGFSQQHVSGIVLGQRWSRIMPHSSTS